VLVLADGHDFSFGYPDEHVMTAARRWMIYAVFALSTGTDIWQVRVDDDGTARAFVTQNTGGMFGTVAPTTGGDFVGGGAPLVGSQGVSMQGDAIYDLFWARVEYILGLREEWRTCRAQDARIDAGEVWGSTEPLCSVTTKDRSPRSDSSQ
jgi:hypothetical protein